jgi:hypothetical protein
MAAALAGIAVVAVVGGALVLGGGLGGGGASPVALASAGPSLASLPPASIQAIASASPIVSASALTAPQDFAGTFNVTWTVVSAESAPGTPIGYPKGSTGTTRVKVTCDSARCAVFPVTASDVRTNPGTPDGTAWGGPWPLTPSGLSYTYSGAEPQCGPAATFTETATYVGTDPVQKDSATIFGGFTGSTSVKYRQLHTKGPLHECIFYDYLVKFTGIRVSP